MSVSMTPSGDVLVRWRDGKHHSRKLSASEIEGLVRHHYGGSQTLDEVVVEWWTHRGSTLAPNTQKLYTWLWDTQVAPYLATMRLSDINPTVIEDWLAGLPSPVPTKRKALALLHQVMNRALKSGYVQSNPCALADRPREPEPERIDPPSPSEIEALCMKAIPRDAMLIRLMAYAGLAPVDALAAKWEQLEDGVLSGRRVKSDRPFRFPVARVLPTLAADLALWRQHGGATKLLGPIIPNRQGGHWTPSAYSNWRKRNWDGEFRVYNLRHTFVSLMLRDPDVTRVEAAEWAGHSLKMQERYSHVLEAGPMKADDAIRAARSEQLEEIAI